MKNLYIAFLITLIPSLALGSENNTALKPRLLPHCVHVTKQNISVNLTNTFCADLKDRIESAIVKSGNKVVDRSLPKKDIFKLGVDIATLTIENSNKIVFTTRTSVSKGVYISKDTSFKVPADIFISPLRVEICDADSLEQKIKTRVLADLRLYIDQYLKRGVLTGRFSASSATDTDVISSSNDSSNIEKNTRPPRKSDEVVEYKYVASKNSKVFHRSDCSSAKRIKPENIIYYKTRAQALKDSKRPCSRCKP